MENNEQNNLKEETIEVLENNTKEENNIEIVGEDKTINVDSNLNVNKSKSKLSKIIIVCVVIIAVLIGGFILYREMFLFNKKNVINTQVNSFFNMLNSGIESFEDNSFLVDYNNDSVGIDGKISFSSNYKGDLIDLSNLDKYSINYNGAIDIKNNKLSFDASLQKSNNKLLSLSAYVFENLALFKSDELTFTTYKYTLDKEIKDINLNNTFNFDDMKKLVNKTNDIVKSTINEKDIEKESVKKTIDGKELSLVKISYDFDLNKLVKDVADSYKEDDEIVEILARLTNSSESDVKEKLNKVDPSGSTQINVVVSVYSDSMFGTLKELVFDFISEDETSTITFDKIDGKNAYKFYTNESDDYKFEGEFNIDDKSLTMKATADDSSISFTIKKDNNKLNVEMLIDYDDTNIKITFDLDSSVNNDSKTDKFNATIVYSEDKESIDFSMDGELKLTKGAKVSEISSSYAKDISLMSEFELSYLETKLESIFTTVFSDFINNDYYSTYNNYNSNYGYSNSL